LPLPLELALGAAPGFARLPGYGSARRVGLGHKNTVDLEVTMKGASKPKKLGKKVAQKSLKEKRQDKRAAAKKGFGSG
jgi:hypothetical protein